MNRTFLNVVELTVRAALTGNRDHVYQAALLDPNTSATLTTDQTVAMWTNPADGTNVIDCNSYANLSTSSTTVNGNFALPSSNFLTLADWQVNNKHGWDADSRVGGFSPSCPAQSIP